MSSYTISKKLNPKKVFILQKSELEKRFDPIFYAHEFNEYENSLNKKPHKKFSQILQSINNGFDFRDYKDSGTPYLKVANIKKGEFDFSKIQYINFDSSEISKNIQLKKGNILLTRKGTFGNAIALEQDYDYVISSEVFYLELKDNSINPKFLEIFFNSKIGQAQFDKNKIGAIMGSLSQEAIRDLKIPFPATDVQNEIVNIFNIYNEKKLNNLEKSKNLLNSIDTYLLKELGITLPEKEENTLKSRMFTASISELSGTRFDPFYNQSYFNTIFKSIENSKYRCIKLKEAISSLRKGTEVGSNEYLENGISFVRVADINNFEINVKTANKKISLDLFEELKENFKPKIGEILFSKDGTIGFSKVVEKDENYIISSGILRIKTNDFINNYFLNYLISTKLYNQLSERVSIGTVIKHLTIEDWLKLSIPIPPLEKQLEIAEHISTIRKQAQDLKDQTKLLLEKANKEIEDILLNT